MMMIKWQKNNQETPDIPTYGSESEVSQSGDEVPSSRQT